MAILESITLKSKKIKVKSKKKIPINKSRGFVSVGVSHAGG
jgi:hypothetical protein